MAPHFIQNKSQCDLLGLCYSTPLQSYFLLFSACYYSPLVPLLHTGLAISPACQAYFCLKAFILCFFHWNAFPSSIHMAVFLYTAPTTPPYLALYDLFSIALFTFKYTIYLFIVVFFFSSLECKLHKGKGVCLLN